MPVMPASDQQMPPFLKICDNLCAHTRVCVQEENCWLDGIWRLGCQRKYDWQLVLGSSSDDYQPDTQTEAAKVGVGDC